jgi:uncharacterized oligopeptide transporter (OPT) family protein
MVFGLRPLHTALGLALSVVGASVCARSAGLTDISPIGAVGHLTQALYGAAAPGQPALNVSAGSMVAGAATETGVLLWSLAAGRALNARVRSQIVGALTGCVFGALLCVPVYGLLVSAFGIGSPQLPVPSGVQWKAMGEMVAQGLGALPPGALPAVVTAAAAGGLLALAGGTAVGRFLPVAVAMGIGMLVPFDYSLAILGGATIVSAGARLQAGPWSRSGAVAGGGLIAGDAIVGVTTALLRSVGLL